MTKDWVQRRAERDERLPREGLERWAEIRSAIQDACTSYNANYDDDVTCRLENGLRVRVTKPKPSAEVVVTYDQKRHVIEAAYSGHVLALKIVSNDYGVVVVEPQNDNELTPDGASEFLLTPFLFP